jgi:hypothetical protein
VDEHGYNQEAESVISSGYNFRLDRAPSAFDRKHVFNSNFFYELPLGKKILNRGPAWNRLAGGWYVAGIFSANTGVPLTVVESTSAWGGAPQIGAVSAGAIPLRTVDASPGINVNVTGTNGVGTSGNPAVKGSGLNLFSDPAQVFASFRPILLSVDGRNGRDTLRGLSHWNFDLSMGKKTKFNEKLSAVFTTDIINIFNHVEFVDPVLSLQSPASFGVLTTQYGTPRAIQLSFRLEF